MEKEHYRRLSIEELGEVVWHSPAARCIMTSTTGAPIVSDEGWCLEFTNGILTKVQRGPSSYKDKAEEEAPISFKFIDDTIAATDVPEPLYPARTTTATFGEKAGRARTMVMEEVFDAPTTDGGECSLSVLSR